MGKYRKKIQAAIDSLRKLDKKDPEFFQKKEKAFIEVHKIIDSHINAELKEEKDFDHLTHSLVNYRKHLEFAKHILDNKIPEEYLSEDDVKTLKKLHKEPFTNDNDFLFVMNQLELALKEQHYITENLANLLKEEKIKLE